MNVIVIPLTRARRANQITTKKLHQIWGTMRIVRVFAVTKKLFFTNQEREVGHLNKQAAQLWEQSTPCGSVYKWIRTVQLGTARFVRIWLRGFVMHQWGHEIRKLRSKMKVSLSKIRLYTRKTMNGVLGRIIASVLSIDNFAKWKWVVDEQSLCGCIRLVIHKFKYYVNILILIKFVPLKTMKLSVKTCSPVANGKKK